MKKVFQKTGIIILLIIVFSVNITLKWVSAAAPDAAAEDPGYPITTNEIADWPAGPDVNSETAVLMEADTGTILYNKGMDEVRYPASITKIMTTLIALENSSLTDEITFTETGVQEAVTGSSNINMQVTEVLTMEQCLHAIMLKSANEVSTQVAEYIGGSVEGFVNQMNEKAQSLGCKNTHFNNANGMPDENHYTTAYDMALITQEAIKNETFVQIAGTLSYEIPTTNMNPYLRSMTHHHPLLLQETAFYYEAAFGGKTGYTDAALSTLVTYAEKDGMTLIAVTLRSSDIGQVCTDTINLLNYGFDNFQKLSMSGEDEVVEGGTAIIPKTKTKADVTIATEEKGDLRNLSYTFQEHPVGEAVVKAVVKAAAEEEEAVQTVSDVPETDAGETAWVLTKAQWAILILGVCILVGIIGILAVVVRRK